MSDTEGASDISDMPPIGAAPGMRGMPGGLPSAIQGLARMFQGFQGRPNPKFLPPPPLTEEQAGQPPKMTGRPASFAPIPPTMPVRPAQWSPFIKTQDDRHYSQWGQPVSYPRLPQTFELPGMFSQLGNYFAQTGGMVGHSAAYTAAYAKAYQDAFQKGQEWKMKMAREGLALHSQQLLEQEQNRAHGYRDTYDEYFEMAGRDATKLATTTIGGVGLMDALHAKAISSEYNDPEIAKMIEQGATVEQIMRVHQDRDRNWRDLSAATERAKQQDVTDELYGLTPKGTTTGAAQEPWLTPPGQQPASSTTSPTTPGPDSTSTAQAGASDAAPEGKQDDTPEALKGVNPLVASAATSIYKGIQPEGMNKAALGEAVAAKQKMDIERNKILNDKSLQPGQYVDAVRKRLGPEVAEGLRDVEDYKIQPGSVSGLGNKQGDYLRGLEELAIKDRPGAKGFNAAYYHDRDVFRNDKTRTLIMSRTNDMAYTLQNISGLMDRIHDELKARGVKDTDINLEAVANVLGGGTYNTLNAALNNFAAAYNVVNSSGHATLGGQQIVAEDFASYKPLSAIRDVIKTHVPSMQGIIKAQHIDWDNIGGKPDDMPHGNLTAERIIDDFGKMDIKTGVLPYGKVVIHNGVPAKWTGKNQFNRDAPENWVDPSSTRD